MKTGALAVAFALIVVMPAAARAEPIPDSVLNKDYDTCMTQVASSPNGTPEQKRNYCLCVRYQLAKNWDLESYGQYALDHLQGKQSPEEGKMQAMARECVAEAMR